jgi:hypothetical protein
MRGPFLGFLATLIIVLVVLGLVYMADIALRALEGTNRDIARVLGVNATTEYSKRADQVAASLVVVLVAAILFIIVVTTVHLRRR